MGRDWKRTKRGNDECKVRRILVQGTAQDRTGVERERERGVCREEENNKKYQRREVGISVHTLWTHRCTMHLLHQ